MFYSIVRRIAALGIAAAALTACNADRSVVPPDQPTSRVSALTPASAAVQLYRDAATVPFSFVVYAGCANAGQGEVLQVSGELQYEGHWTTSQDGQRTHHALVERFTGVGIGWDTGESYDVAMREHSQGNITDGTDGIQDAGEDLEREQLTLTSRTTGLVIEITLTSKFVQTPNGDYVLDGWDAKSRCR